MRDYVGRAMVEIYGTNLQSCCIAVADEGYGKARLACAIEKACLDSLLDHCQGTGLVVTQVAPAIQGAYMALRQQLDGTNGIFMLLEPTCLVVLRWEQGIAVDVEVMPRQADVLAQARDAVARLALQVGEVGSISLAAIQDPGEMALPPGWQGLHWPARPLPGFDGAWLAAVEGV